MAGFRFPEEGFEDETEVGRLRRRLKRAEASTPSRFRDVPVREPAGDLGASAIGKAAAAERTTGAKPGRVRGGEGGGEMTSIAAGGAMAYGHPAALAAGMGLQVLAAKSRRKERERNIDYEARLERVSRQQKAIDKLIGVSQGLRNL